MQHCISNFKWETVNIAEKLFLLFSIYTYIYIGKINQALNCRGVLISFEHCDYFLMRIAPILGIDKLAIEIWTY